MTCICWPILFWCMLVMGREISTPALSCKDGELAWRDIFTTTLTLCLDRPSARLHYQRITQWTMSGQRVLLDMWAQPCCSITGIIVPPKQIYVYVIQESVIDAVCLAWLQLCRLKGTRPLAAASVLSLLIDSLGWLILARHLPLHVI